MKYTVKPTTKFQKDLRRIQVTPGWLLVYEIDNGELILYLTRTGIQ